MQSLSSCKVQFSEDKKTEPKLMSRNIVRYSSTSIQSTARFDENCNYAIKLFKKIPTVCSASDSVFRRTSTPNLAKATIRIFATAQNRSVGVDEAKQLNGTLARDYQSSKELSQMYFPALCVNAKNP